jgi:hypothetical protein
MCRSGTAGTVGRGNILSDFLRSDDLETSRADLMTPRSSPLLAKALLVLLLVASASMAVPATAQAAAPADFAVKTVWELDGDLAPGEFIWDEEGVPAGRIRVVVDLDAETLYVYRGGNEIGRSTIIYGFDAKPTPTGVFPIMRKIADHYSSTYGGAPMPYTLRLTRDGVAIHGSSNVDEDYATHGCVGIPKEFARLLFSQAKVGDRVLVTHGWLDPDYDSKLAASQRPARIVDRGS